MASLQSSSLPKRAIFTDVDLQAFLLSPTKEELLKFISASGQSCATKDEDDEDDEDHPLKALSPGLACWLGALQGMLVWLDELPPLTGIEIRFGNPAFKQWHSRLLERAPHIISTILKITHQYPPSQEEEDYDAAILKIASEHGRQAAAATTTASPVDEMTDPATVTEICAYLHDAFGHAVRLDYGTGHESSFQITLFALFKCGVFGNSAAAPPTKRRLKAATISLWNAYLTVTRGLQRDYRLEPAGSHGVWGLDDYHCLVFYYGAQQLVPKDGVPSDIYQIHNNDNDMMYYSCIDFIRELKSKAPFAETSPMLHDISYLKGWPKVASGLLKLYQGEVLSKRPVVQHWVFGPLFPATWTPSSQQSSRMPPTDTLFRMTPSSDGTMPMQQQQGGGAAAMPSTRAPWAK
jgi:hypothetical protein